MQAPWPVKDGSFDFSPLSSEGRPPARQTTTDRLCGWTQPLLLLQCTTAPNTPEYQSTTNPTALHHIWLLALLGLLHQGFASKLAPRFCTRFCTKFCQANLYQSLATRFHHTLQKNNKKTLWCTKILPWEFCQTAKSDTIFMLYAIAMFPTSQRWQTQVRSQKKITVLFGNFSQNAGPPPHPPLLGTPYSKKKIIVYFAF